MVVLKSSAQRLVACAISWIVIGSVAIILRLIAKRRTKGAFSLDDGWCLFALILITVFNALQIAGQLVFGCGEKFSADNGPQLWSPLAVAL